jgi:hypothetical protein
MRRQDLREALGRLRQEHRLSVDPGLGPQLLVGCGYVCRLAECALRGEAEEARHGLRDLRKEGRYEGLQGKVPIAEAGERALCRMREGY